MYSLTFRIRVVLP